MRQTFVSELVRDDYLPNAVALNSASFNVARMIGPAVAGILTVAVGPGWVFLINTLTFVALLLSLWKIPRRRCANCPGPRPERAGSARGCATCGSGRTSWWCWSRSSSWAPWA